MDKTVSPKKGLILKIMPFLASLAFVAYVVAVLVFPEANTTSLLYNIPYLVALLVGDFFLAKSYSDHDKNLMKSVLGFELCGLLMLAMHYAFTLVDFSKWDFVVRFVIFLLIVVFATNQFLLANDHYSRPVVLFVSQGTISLLAVGGIAAGIADAVVYGDNALIFLSLLAFALISMLLVLIIETKVQGFKVAREEKGYVFVKTESQDAMLEEEDRFISNGWFMALPWIIVLGLVGSLVFNAIFDKAFTSGYLNRYLIAFAKFLGLLVAVLSYRSHNKDVMKMMVGFLLGMLLFENLYEISCLAWKSISATLLIKNVFTIALLPFNVLFLVFHWLLVHKHGSDAKMVKKMQVVYLVYAILIVAVALGWQVYYLVAKGENYYFFFLKPILWLVTVFPVVTGIVTIDTRVNGLKFRREHTPDAK